MEILELAEKSVWTESEQKKLYQAYKGELKIGVYINSGLLTVHVVQSRNLSSKITTKANAFIKLSIVPDELEKSGCKTDVKNSTNNPLFNEKFSFELMPEDMEKRLLVTVWNRIQKKRCSELLGCMSFGLQNVRNNKTPVSGWYYLLSEYMGQGSHMQANSRRYDLNTSCISSGSSISPQDVDPDHVEPINLILRKRSGSGSYGFGVTGSHPVQVCRVDAGGPADHAGVEPGDWIIRVNGEDVSTATSECVGRIIRHYQKKITLEVCRPIKTSSSPKAPCSTGPTPLPCTRPNPVSCTGPAPLPCTPRVLPWETAWQPGCSLLDSSSGSSCEDHDRAMEQQGWKNGAIEQQGWKEPPTENSRCAPAPTPGAMATTHTPGAMTTTHTPGAMATTHTQGDFGAFEPTTGCKPSLKRNGSNPLNLGRRINCLRGSVPGKGHKRRVTFANFVNLRG